MKKLKEEFESDINLNLSPYNPEFEQKFEFRDFTYPPTTTLIFKVSIVFTILVLYFYRTKHFECIFIIACCKALLCAEDSVSQLELLPDVNVLFRQLLGQDNN